MGFNFREQSAPINIWYAETMKDGWTMVVNKGDFMAQHEHTIVVTEGKPIVLTEMSEIWN
ncbi:MAG: hypothetical protein ABI359_00905 [Ginsengibacter sp.]